MTADLRIEADIVMVLKLIRFHFIDDKVLEVSCQSSCWIHVATDYSRKTWVEDPLLDHDLLILTKQ